MKGYFDKQYVGDALAVQRQETRSLKSGTKKLMESGIRQASRLADEGVRPHQVAKVMEAEVLQSQRVSTTMTQKEVTPQKTFLIEWCCERDSYLMQE